MKRDEWFYLKLLTIIFVGICPYIIAISEWPLISLSSAWNTPLQPLFILMNAATSYFFFSIVLWRIPAICLMLLTAFSVKFYPGIHDVLAIIFFLSALRAMIIPERFLEYLWIYLFGGAITLSKAFGFRYGILIGEVVSITALCLYHLEILIYKQSLIKKRDKLSNNWPCDERSN